MRQEQLVFPLRFAVKELSQRVKSFIVLITSLLLNVDRTLLVTGHETPFHFYHGQSFQRKLKKLVLTTLTIIIESKGYPEI